MINIQFLEGSEAESVLLNSDQYIDKMQPYERGIRMGLDHDVNREQFCEHVVKHVLEWTDYEKKCIMRLVRKISDHLVTNGFKGKYPETIGMIKTSGKEDVKGCAGYCRRNTIVTNKSNVSYRFLVHELFHIFSQNNPDLICVLYNSIGFFRCNEIELPEEIKKTSFTNPDAQDHDVYIDVTHKGRRLEQRLF